MIVSDDPENSGEYSQWPVGLSIVLIECPHNMATRFSTELEPMPFSEG